MPSSISVGHHFAADVLHRVHRRRGEIALLEPDLVTQIGRVLVAAAPDALAAADVILGEIDPLVVKRLVEDEKLQLRPEIGGVGDLRSSSDTSIALRAIERGSRLYSFLVIGSRTSQIIDSVVCMHERIDLGGVGNRHQQHVRLVDRLPAADAAAVEAEAMFEAFEGQFADGHRGVLPQPGEIHEAQIDELHFPFFA